MIEMGRKKTSHPDLPPRMVARVLASGKRLFYYGRQKIPLGSDLLAARIEWAKLENAGIAALARFPQIAEQYEKEIIPTLRLSSQREYRRAVKNLSASFLEFSLEDIEPADVKDYMNRRSRKIAAVREKSVLSAIFKWARETRLTNAPNPCDGVGFSKQEKATFEFTGKRNRYVTEPEFNEIRQKAEPIIQDVMDLCLLTGQRLGDVIRWTRQDIRDGRLHVKQSKTGKELKIRVEGELKRVVERILTRPRAIQTIYLIADDKGQRMSVGKVDSRFRKIKGDWQMRDLRAKMVTDEPDIRVAQRRAGHASEQTTAGIYRRIKGDDVGPLR